MSVSRASMAERICERIDKERTRLERQWATTGPINYFVVDDLMPLDQASEIRSSFPDLSDMALKRSIRELKYVAAQMDRYSPLLEESIYAFQASGVVRRIQEITNLGALEQDELLYAGGISLMAHGHYLNPHVNNSHDKFRERYRVLNLLYYLSPDWSESNGCNLELWPDGPKGQPITILSKFNRLVVMVTHRGSWHSISKNTSSKHRCCVSNYYFSREPVGQSEYFHFTSFRGRPEQPIRDIVLRTDIWIRMMVRRIFAKGIKENPHFYKK